ncbi:MAG: AAA family ATPase [Pseudonocardiaceae bacterium]
MSLAKRFGDLSLFDPNARYLGFDVGLVDRQSESTTLLRLVESGQPVIAIEGKAGVGKTALAAHLCRHAGRRREIRWVFCDEKRASFNLVALSKALASSADSRSAIRLRAAITRRIDVSEIVDATIDSLATQSLLLILDNFHAVTDTDPGIYWLLERLARSHTASSLVLTSDVRLRELHAIPLIAQLELPQLELHGLSAEDARVLLSRRDVSLPVETARAVWQCAGGGNPLALTLFAGRVRDTNPEKLAELALNLPSSADDLGAWITPVFGELALDSQTVVKIIAFAYEPMSRDALHAIVASLDLDKPLTDLTSRFLITANAGRFEMHSAVRDYIITKTTDSEQSDLAKRFTDYYQGQARAVFIDEFGQEEPSYGTLFLESFPDYYTAVDRHICLIDDLLERLADNGYHMVGGEKILVLGSGDGTHDPGFAKHGLDVTNVEIQPEIADFGRSKTAALPAEIKYVVADMTKPLPAEIAGRSMDAVFNIGTSFGYESTDDVNSGAFRNAEESLSDGAPFVFQYVNRRHWEGKRVQRQIEVTPMSNGSIRTLVRITNPGARTLLTLIGLQRADGTGGWFRHFMRFYCLDEILAMMTAASLRPVAIYGGKANRVTGEPFDEKESEAMVIIAVPACGTGRPRELSAKNCVAVDH